MPNFSEEPKQLIEVEANWKGPYVLQGDQGELFSESPVSDKCGIYLFTVDYDSGYLIYMAGLTQGPFIKRINTHIQTYKSGTYTIFDCADLRKGIRTELWHGLWMSKKTNTPERRELWKASSQNLMPAINELLSTFRIFFAPLNVEKRYLERIEASVMNILYSQPEPMCSIPDKGMRLLPRRKMEIPFIIHNVSDVLLHGLPERLEA